MARIVWVVDAFDKQTEEHVGDFELPDDVDDDDMRAVLGIPDDVPLMGGFIVTERAVPFLQKWATDPIDLDRFDYIAEQCAIPERFPMAEMLDDPEENDVYSVIPNDLPRLRREAGKRGLTIFETKITWCESEPDFVATVFRAIGAPPQYEPTWRGLVEALTDLSWAPAPGWVLVVNFVGHPDPDEAYAAWYDALHALQDAAYRWEELFHKPFYVVTLGPYRATYLLPELV